jgi:hypothetical protein
MPYVNIPVPEEHVEEIMQFVVRTMQRAAMETWDEDAVHGFFGELDESSRALLAYIARATLADKELTEAEATQLMQVSWREVFGMARDLNERAAKANRPPLINYWIVTEKLANGRTTEQRVYALAPEVAPLVDAADRADLLADVVPGSLEAGSS